MVFTSAILYQNGAGQVNIGVSLSYDMVAAARSLQGKVRATGACSIAAMGINGGCVNSVKEG